MSFSDIKQVIEEVEIASVNQRLGEGWELLAVVQCSDKISGHSFPCYVLGQAGRRAAEAHRLLQESRGPAQCS